MPDAVTAVQLLGPARVTLGGITHPFALDQRHQLLGYLAWRGDWVGREDLASLFWSESAPHAARDKLRHLLGRARALDLGLEAGREGVRWAVPTDVAAFARATTEGNWARALTLYHGPLLDGLDPAGTGAFSAWLERERERLHGSWRTALLRQAGELGAAGDHLQAAELLRPLLEDEEPDEVALQLHVDALLRDGGRERARRAYGAFVERLRREFGLEPTAELAGLGRTLHAPAAVQPAEAPPLPGVPALPPGPAPPLPVPPTSFVGRDLDLAEITRLLSWPECRLLTLTGPGGIGKTRLALEAARTLGGTFPDGVFFVPLAALAGGDALPGRVADALGVPLRGQEEPLDQVVCWIGDRRLLLVLDNIEHLPEGAPLALDLVRRCPGLRLLVTSRERLGVEAEWLLTVGGLDYPEGTDLSLPHSGQFDAVQLFVERARRVRPGFTPGGGDAADLVAICRLVEGSPLGLELAAVWVRVLSLADLRQQMEADLDFLGAVRPGDTGRHASLRAVFEHSWRRLSPGEQETLRRLSVFRGGFRLGAARLVAGATLPGLAALVDKSLLRVSPAGRYDRHALIYQYSREKLAEHPAEEAQAQSRHGRYYLSLLAEQGEAVQGPGSKAALAALDEELGNVRLAWHWATGNGRVEELRPAAVHGILYFNVRSRQQEGYALYGEAARALEEHARPGSPLGEVLIRQAWFADRLGRHGEARELGERGLALVPPGSSQAAHGHNTLGVVAGRSGNYAQAARHFGEALALAERLGLEARLIPLRRNLATLCTALGWLDEAGRHVEALLALGRRLDSRFGRFDGPYTQGQLALAAGQLAEAESALGRSLAVARELDFRSEVPDLLYSLAVVAHERGDLDGARRLGGEGLAEARASGDLSVEAASLNVLGRASAALGRGEEARAHLAEGLRLTRTSRQTPQLLENLTYLAELRVRQGRAGEAAPLLGLVLGHPSAHHRLKVLAGRLLGERRSRLTPEDLDPARLEALADEALAGLG